MARRLVRLLLSREALRVLESEMRELHERRVGG